MLVVMHNRNIEGALQTLLDIETLWGLDVLQIDTAKGGRNLFDSLAELLRIFLVNLDIEHVDATIDLEQQTFTLHDGLTAHRTDVA